jgi:universal stress protein family protein
MARGPFQTREVGRGRPERQIVNMTSRDGSDLLVVGHRGVSRVHRLKLGSVSEYCEYKRTHGPCSYRETLTIARRV